MKTEMRLAALVLLAVLIGGCLSACGPIPDVQNGIVMTQHSTVTYTEETVADAQAALYGLIYRLLSQRTRLNDDMKQRVATLSSSLLSLTSDAGTDETKYRAYFAKLTEETDVLVTEWQTVRRAESGVLQEAPHWAALYRDTLATFGTVPCAAILLKVLRVALEEEMDLTRTHIASCRNDPYLYPHYVARLEEEKTQYEALCALDEKTFTDLFRTVVMLLNVLTRGADTGADTLRTSYTPEEALLFFREMDFSVCLTDLQWNALQTALTYVPGKASVFVGAALSCGDGEALGTWTNEVFCLLCDLQTAVTAARMENLLTGDTAVVIDTVLSCFSDCSAATVGAVTGLQLKKSAYVDLFPKIDAWRNVMTATPVTYEAFCALPVNDRVGAISGLVGGCFHD